MSGVHQTLSGPGFLAIVNGAAGGGRCSKRATEALDALRAKGLFIDVVVTQHAGHASELAREAYERGERHILAVGGDGTTYEIINGLFPLVLEHPDDPVTLGMLPLGTGNSFLRDFGIENEADAVASLARGRTRSIDVIRVEHAGGILHFINLLTVGFVTNAGDLTNRRFKPLGEAGYLLAAMIGVARLRHERDPMRVDGELWDDHAASFTCFGNSQFTGGKFHIAPHADPGDGLVDIVRARTMNRPRFVKNLIRCYEGRHVEDGQVDERRAKRVEFLQPRERLVMLDGEIQKLTLHALEVLPGALEVVA